jgi:hypothetical protein
MKTFLYTLAAVWITLRLTHVIAWSWWLVLAPLWVELALILVVIAAGLFTAVVIAPIALTARRRSGLTWRDLSRISRQGRADLKAQREQPPFKL